MRIVKAIGAGLAALLALGAVANADVLDDIKKRGTLIVGVKPDYKPFGLRDPSGAFYNKDIAQKYGPEIASFDGSEKPLLALKNSDCIGYLYDQPFIAGKLTDDDWKGGYHMPLPGIMETPWAIAVKLGEAGLQKFMEDISKEWMKSGRIVELEKKWGVPPTDYAKRMHDKAKSGS